MFARLSVVLTTLTLFAAVACAEQQKPQAQLGQAAPDFELANVVTGETVKLSDHGDKIVVLVWQGIKCPWNEMRPGGGYERVLFPMAQQYKDKDVVFLAINSNKTEPTDTLASYAKQHDMPYALLKDTGNKVADIYGARTTPHFFVIDKEGTLRYRGGFEQVPGNPEECGEMQEAYLVPVLDALIAGSEPPYTETKSKGCGIQRE